MLLPVVVLARRADTVMVIGAALEAKATGVGHRRIAAKLGRPAETVRGWLRRFARRVDAVRAVFTRWCRALSADPVLPGPAGSGWADAIAAITAVAGEVGTRFGIGEVPVWRVACAVSAGRLLAPRWPAPDSSGDQHELTLTLVDLLGDPRARGLGRPARTSVSGR